jgi:hypothetical protein
VPMLVRIDRPNLALLRGADYPGIALMALFLGCLEYTLEEGPRWVGSATTLYGPPHGSPPLPAWPSSGAV